MEIPLDRCFGFWRENSAVQSESIFEATRGSLSGQNLQLVSAYLAACPILIASPGISRSVFDRSKIAGTFSVQTNGRWAWPDTMSYYVRHHGIDPPEDFVKEVVQGGGVAPTEDDIDIRNLTLPSL